LSWPPPPLEHLADPVRFYDACAARYGLTFTMPTGFGVVVVSGDPEVAKEVYSAPPDTWCAFEPKMLGPFLGDGSVIVRSGADHARERSLMGPPFRGERMRSYGPAILGITRNVLQELPLDEPFSMLEVAQTITLNVMCRAVLGLDVESAEARLVRRAVLGYVAAMNPWIVFLPALRTPLLGPWRRFVGARTQLDELVYGIIARRRGRAAGDDILSLLLEARYEDGKGMTDQEVRDELLTLMFAGYETTAITIAWAMYFLSQDPYEHEALKLALDMLGPELQPSAVVALPPLVAVCNEAARFRSVVVDVPRTATRPFELLHRYTLAPGDSISVSPLLLHRNRNIFAAPERFWSERFVDRKFSPFEFAPFGGGARRCLGAAFAMYEMPLVLAVMHREFNFVAAPGEPEVWARRQFVMGPKHGVMMVRRPLPEGAPVVKT
jgi:cytochrome P450